MGEEKFEWTDDDVIDFHKKYMGSESHNIFNYLKQFKQSKLNSNKDLEIISYKNGNNIWYVKDYGKTWVIDTSKMDINSVKRLSDKELFSVGDYVNDDYNTMKIEKIKVENDSIVLVGNIGNMQLRFAKKRKQPLFKTEDGKEIFEGDDCWLLSEGNWLIHLIKNVPQKPFTGINNHFKYFSTEQAAKDYIIMNKPCLSLKEINFWIEKEKYLDYPGGIAIHQLKQLVEKRINYK